jgi:hypothetical protein
MAEEATTQGLDIRFVVTSLETGSAEHIYETYGTATVMLHCSKAATRASRNAAAD